MKKIFRLIPLLVCIVFNSCSDGQHDLSGSYADNTGGQVTKVTRMPDGKYELTSPDGKEKVTMTRNENILSGIFRDKKISCEFNATCDTMTGKLEGKIVFTGAKVKKGSDK